MAVHVTLEIFSGRPNPTWVLSDSQIKDLTRFRETQPKAFRRAAAPAALGYRGFTLREIGGDTGKPTIASRGRPLLGGHVAEAEVAEFLLRTAPVPILPDDIRKHVQDRIPDWRKLIDLGKILKPLACPICKAADAPAYNPSFWNTPGVQPYNNCYNYANNQATNTFAQPGRAHGISLSSLQCGPVSTAAQADGLQSVPNFSATRGPGQGWYVALVIWPNTDYHWYRQDKVGCWSHKPGQTAARNTDNSGNTIQDPQTCNRGPYTQFCGYMATGSWVRIQ